LPFSFTAHAKDLYSPSLNPAGLLRRKMDAARFVVTCTEANSEYLKQQGSDTPVYCLYHGLNADFSRLLRERPAERPTNGHLRVLTVGRLVPKKGFDVLVEAMDCGLPVITTGISGIPEVIRHGVNGLLVPPDNPEALADAVLRLKCDADLAGRLSRGAQATVRERFDADGFAAQLAALFR